MKPIKVICFYWQGERWQEEGVDYEKPQDVSFVKHLERSSPIDRELVCKYVNNLYDGVMKWAVHPFDFICFTNDDLEVDENIELRPFKLVTNKGVLPRMYMFSETAGLFGHQVLSLDIDVVITGPLRDIMNYSGLFCVRKRWQPGQTHLPDGDIMSFQAGIETQSMFWDAFIKDIKAVERSTGGRERFWIDQVLKNRKWDDWDDFALGQVSSYKIHVKRNGTLGNSRIVSCHGHPRPHEIKEQWRIKNWK